MEYFLNSLDSLHPHMPYILENPEKTLFLDKFSITLEDDELNVLLPLEWGCHSFLLWECWHLINWDLKLQRSSVLCKKKTTKQTNCNSKVLLQLISLAGAQLAFASCISSSVQFHLKQSFMALKGVIRLTCFLGLHSVWDGFGGASISGGEGGIHADDVAVLTGLDGLRTVSLSCTYTNQG